MSYRQSEYEIIPKTSYKILRSCGKCGCKTMYQNTNRFRVNANGNKVDIWLIYQCEVCKHTYNLSIYERVNPSAVKAQQYAMFLGNDPKLALKYGTDKAIFRTNKAQVDMDDITYTVEALKDCKSPKEPPRKDNQEQIVIHNPYELKIRTEKVLALLLACPRCQIKQQMDAGSIVIESRYLGRRTVILIDRLV